MRTKAVLVHTCTTTKGQKVSTSFALGQVWIYKDEIHVVDRVYPKRVRFDCGSLYFTVGQEPFAKHAKLVLNPTVSK